VVALALVHLRPIEGERQCWQAALEQPLALQTSLELKVGSLVVDSWHQVQEE